MAASWSAIEQITRRETSEFAAGSAIILP